MSIARKLSGRLESGVHVKSKDPANVKKGEILQALRTGLESLEGRYWSTSSVIARAGEGLSRLAHLEAGMNNFTPGVLRQLGKAFGCDVEDYLDGKVLLEDQIERCLHDRRRL